MQLSCITNNSMWSGGSTQPLIQYCTRGLIMSALLNRAFFCWALLCVPGAAEIPGWLWPACLDVAGFVCSFFWFWIFWAWAPLTEMNVQNKCLSQDSGQGVVGLGDLWNSFLTKAILRFCDCVIHRRALYVKTICYCRDFTVSYSAVRAPEPVEIS